MKPTYRIKYIREEQQSLTGLMTKKQAESIAEAMKKIYDKVEVLNEEESWIYPGRNN